MNALWPYKKSILSVERLLTNSMSSMSVGASSILGQKGTDGVYNVKCLEWREKVLESQLTKDWVSERLKEGIMKAATTLQDYVITVHNILRQLVTSLTLLSYTPMKACSSLQHCQ